jgi:hypothetical protein
MHNVLLTASILTSGFNFNSMNYSIWNFTIDESIGYRISAYIRRSRAKALTYLERLQCFRPAALLFGTATGFFA